MRGFLQALGAGLAVFLITADASAQDSERQVRAYLEHGMQRHAALGYAADATIPDLATPLRLDHPFLWSVYLVEGQTYRVYGACDDACADLDMEIYSADGQLVDRDTARDDTPYVQIAPTRSGRAYVRIWLYACRSEQCHVAARVVSGGAPSPRSAAEALGEGAAEQGH